MFRKCNVHIELKLLFVILLVLLKLVLGFHLGIEFYLFVSHGGMKRQRVHM